MADQPSSRSDRRWIHGMNGWQVWTFADGVSAYGEVTGFSHEDGGTVYVVLDGEDEPRTFGWGDVRPV